MTEQTTKEIIPTTEPMTTVPTIDQQSWINAIGKNIINDVETSIGSINPITYRDCKKCKKSYYFNESDRWIADIKYDFKYCPDCNLKYNNIGPSDWLEMWNELCKN